MKRIGAKRQTHGKPLWTGAALAWNRPPETSRVGTQAVFGKTGVEYSSSPFLTKISYHELRPYVAKYPSLLFLPKWRRAKKNVPERFDVYAHTRFVTESDLRPEIR